MKTKKRFIFDMDGTLYETGSVNFIALNIRKNSNTFFMEKFGFSNQKAISEYERIKIKYNGEISIGVEKEYGINRHEYFNKVWNFQPSKYIQKDNSLKELFEKIKGKVAILTTSPRVWAERVLNYLEILEFFKDSLFTGEPDVRKPDLKAFQQVIDYFKILPNNIYFIGDQEDMDIIPAKKLGMKTIIVGKESKYADFQINSIKELSKFLDGKLK